MATYSISEFVVSDANPAEFEFGQDNVEAISAVEAVTRMIHRVETDKPGAYPEYDVRTVRIVITVTY